MDAGVQTLRDALKRAAASAPGKGITIFDRRGRNPSRRTYREILDRALEFAARWISAGVAPGDRVLIAQPVSWQWVDGWLGALMARAVPVAAPPGGVLGSGRAALDRIEALAGGTGARFALVSDSVREDAVTCHTEFIATRGITFKELTAVTPAGSIPERDDPSAAAFLQFTSGTEGTPRAVAISDRAAIHNVTALNHAILEPLENKEISAIVSWLPLHHDMGLAGAFLQAILTGRELSQFPPAAFLANSRAWLEEISRRPSLSLLPDFGFRHCTDRFEDSAARDLDLNNWRAAICGAETIHAATIERFTAAASLAGFRPQAFRAGYGLAEATVAVTLDRRAQGVRTRSGGASPNHEVVCVGAPVSDTEIRCIGPDGSVRGEDQTGEILVRGPGLLSGYHGAPDATRNAFLQGWLRTGDLGFVHDGELYLTGRLKDVLIIRGEKFMPQELEWAAEGICGGRSRAAAFSVDAGNSGEQAVLLVETAELDSDRLAHCGCAIRERIGQAFGVQLGDLVFLKHGRLPSSASGKLRRAEARSFYLDGRLRNSRSEVLER